jgi:hypothetical protein
MIDVPYQVIEHDAYPEDYEEMETKTRPVIKYKEVT